MEYMQNPSEESYKFPVENHPTSEVSEIDKILNTLDTQGTNPEKTKIFKNMARSVYPLLDKEEQQQMLQDPINFTSKNLLFRGVDRLTMAEFMISQEMQPQNGEFGSKAVYTSDSPYSASSYMNEQGILLVFNKQKIRLSDSGIIYDVNDPNLKQEFNKYLESLPETERKTALYTGYNNWDIASQPVQNKPWKNVELRSAQPLDAVAAIIVVDNGKPHTYNPTNETDRFQLNKLLFKAV